MITYGPLNHAEMLRNLFSVINQSSLGEYQNISIFPLGTSALCFGNKTPFKCYNERKRSDMLKEEGEKCFLSLNVLIVILLIQFRTPN